MKRKALLILLTLVMVLTLSVPTTALAAKPVSLNAQGTISAITAGDVFPAGNSGRYVVASRTITGTLMGDIAGDFILDYKANVELATQAGNLHGTLVAGSQTLVVNGKIEPLEFAGWYIPPGVHPLYPDGIPLFQLTINGHWNGQSGVKGNGDFTSFAVFVPTPEGHVGFIVASGIYLTGK